MTKVRARSRLLPRYFEVSEGAHRVVDWAWSLGARQHRFVSQTNGGHNRVPGGSTVTRH